MAPWPSTEVMPPSPGHVMTPSGCWPAAGRPWVDPGLPAAKGLTTSGPPPGADDGAVALLSDDGQVVGRADLGEPEGAVLRHRARARVVAAVAQLAFDVADGVDRFLTDHVVVDLGIEDHELEPIRAVGGNEGIADHRELAEGERGVAGVFQLEKLAMDAVRVGQLRVQHPQGLADGVRQDAGDDAVQEHSGGGPRAVEITVGDE